MAKPTLEQALEIVARSAPSLRAAGVTEIEVDGVRVALAPRDPGPTMPDVSAVSAEGEPPPSDPLKDPFTFGLSAGSQVPGFKHLQRRGEPQ